MPEGRKHGLRFRLKSLLVKLRLYGPIYRAREVFKAAVSPIREARGPDGLPLPGSYLMTLVVGNANAKAFYDSGVSALTEIAGLVDRNGGDFHSFRDVLDFGCGCGRLARHLPRFTKGQIYGSDYNPRLLRWCQQNLPGQFVLNGLLPPLPFDDASFDCVYALSVFTHLREETQFRWLEELRRVIRTGGYLVISFRDDSFMTDAVLKKALAERGFLIENDLLEGSNLIGASQSHAYIRTRFSPYFTVLEIVPGDAPRYIQALALLKKQ